MSYSEVHSAVRLGAGAAILKRVKVDGILTESEGANTYRKILNVYMNTASSSESSLTPQEAEIVRTSLADLQEGKFQTFDSTEDLIKQLESEND